MNRLCGFTVLALVCTFGCKPKAMNVSVGSGSMTWTSANAGTTPGLEEGSATWGSVGGPIRFMICSDATSTGKAGSSTNPKGANFKGEFKTKDGRVVPYNWDTTDGVSGTFTIDGKDYDIAQGGLFLLSLRGPQTRVLQLNREAGNVAGDYLNECKKDPEIQKFFAADAN